MTFKRFTFYVITLAFIGKVTCRLFYSESPKVEAKYQQTGTVKFFSNFSGYPTYALKSIFVDVRPGTDKEETVATGGHNGFSSQANMQFDNRLNAVVIDEQQSNLKVFTMFISNLNFDDNVQFKATVVYTDGTVGEDGSKILRNEFALTTLEVFGGPLSCAGKLPPITNITAIETSTINVTLCGKPLPTVKWSMGNHTFTSSSRMELGAAKYKYILTLDNVNSTMCGKHVSFHAEGYSDDITDKTMLHVIFKPVVTINYNYRVNSSCVRMMWKQVDMGLCTGLIYQIQYLNENESVIATTNQSQAHSEYTHCGDISTIKNGRIRGIFDNHAGEWQTKEISLVAPTSAATPGTGKSTNLDGDDWVTDAILGGVLGGLALIVIIVIIIVCCCSTACLVCCGCKDKEKPLHSNSNSFGFHYKRNSKNPPTRIVEDDQPNQVYAVDSPPPAQPAVIYATSEKPKTVPKNNEPQFFDPSEFGLEPDNPAPVTSHYSNTTYVDDDDEDFSNKPSMLI